MDKKIMKFGKISIKTKVVQVFMALAVVALVSNSVFAGRKFALAGYKMDGSLDTAFGQNGKLIPDFPGASSAQAAAMAVDSSQRVAVAGWADGDPLP